MDKRLKLFQMVVIVLFGILFLKAGHLQLVQGDYYYQLSEGNRISIRPINAPGGKILVNSKDNDSSYKTLVSNRLSYNLYILPNEIPAELSVDDLLKKVTKLIDLEVVQVDEDKIENIDYKDNSFDIEEVKEKVDSDTKEYELLKSNYESNRESNQYRSLPVLLKKNISSENMLIIEENKKELPGILVKESTIRKYLYNDLASHILEGMERKYAKGDNNYLKGVDGLEQIEVNNLGEEIRTLGIKPPVSGDNLVLNLDLELQKATEELIYKEFERLREKAEDDEDISSPTGVGVIVMDPNSGAIKTMSSVPGYDLNIFAEGISSKEFKEINNNKLRPLFNRNIMAEVPPGSVFKLVTGAAAIEHLNVNTDSIFYDKDGTFSKPEWDITFKNWYPAGEGELSFTRAVARSNNIIFYQLAYKLYQEYKGSKLIEVARDFGLGSKTGIDLPEEKSGLVPDGEWKRKRFGQGWLPGDSVNLSIGQGNLATTPIQIAQIISIIANEGIMYQPQVLDKVVDSEGNIIKEFEPEIIKNMEFDNNVFSILKKGMREVTQYSRGTAAGVFRDFPIEVAGKTGTAQTSRINTNHGWFAGFAPYEDPEVVVLVFLENGSSSSYTLPLAADILQEYFALHNGEADTEKEGNNNGSEEDNSESSEIADNRELNSSFNLFDYFEKVFSQ